MKSASFAHLVAYRTLQVEQRSAGTRRRTWAESSVYHGDAYAGSATNYSGRTSTAIVHENTCPVAHEQHQPAGFRFVACPKLGSWLE